MYCSACGKVMSWCDSYYACNDCNRIEKAINDSDLKPSLLTKSKLSKPMIITTGTAILIIGLALGWLNSVVTINDYVQRGLKIPQLIAKGYTLMEVVSIRDMPGYGGGLGRRESKKYAEKLQSEEIENHKLVTSKFSYLLINRSVRNCINQIHQNNLELTDSLIEYSNLEFVNLQRFDSQFDSIEEKYTLNFKCSIIFNHSYSHVLQAVNFD